MNIRLQKFRKDCKKVTGVTFNVVPKFVMAEYSNFFFFDYFKNIKNDFFSLGRNKNKKEYVKCGFSFDIETTSTEINDEKTAWCYHWQMGISSVDGKRQDCFYGRNLKDFKNVCDNISNILKDKYIICLVHNLSYEFTFLLEYLCMEDIFAKSENDVIKCRYRQIEFRCSYAFSNMSLNLLSKTYTTTKKAVGDLDYNKLRFPSTPLTKTEKYYCYCDVKILLEYWHMHIRPEYIDGKSRKWLPLTNTAKVRHDMQMRIKDWQAYKRLFSSVYPTEEEYNILRKVFYGGVVRANAKYTGLILRNQVASRDRKSSYPSSQLQKTYPMSRFYRIKKEENYKFSSDDFVKIYHVNFKNIVAKTDLSVMPIDKAMYSKDIVLDNGRLYSASLVSIWCTDVDFEIWTKYYTGSYEIQEIWVSKRGKLCRFQIESLYDYFLGKETLKGKDPELYLKMKNMLNSNFGCCVQKHNDLNITLKNDEWKKESIAYKQNNSEFLLYQWGVWITAWSRYELLMTAKKLIDDGGTVIYMDTDSIKYLYDNGKHEHIFIKENDRYYIENTRAINYYDIRKSLHEKKIIRNLGNWELETDKQPGKVYGEFCTLGSKRYISDGKPTISGLPIQGFYNYCKTKNIKPIDAFKSGTEFSPELINKLAMTYVLQGEQFKIYDDNGDPFITPKHFIHAKNVGFKLKLSEDYENFVQMVQNKTAMRGKVV